MTTGAIHRKLSGDMVRVGRRIVIGRMTTRTGVGRIIVISVMTSGTIVGNRRVGPVQHIILVVDREARWCPARVRRVAHGAIRWEIQRRVVRIAAGIVIRGMAGGTLRGRARISIGMALVALRSKMRASEREIGQTVVKSIVSIARWVTNQTGRTFIHVAVYAAVVLICFRIDVASSAGKFRKIGWIQVAFCTFHPLALVFAAVNREVLRVMLRILRRRPARICCMTTGAIG